MNFAKNDNKNKKDGFFNLMNKPKNSNKNSNSNSNSKENLSSKVKEIAGKAMDVATDLGDKMNKVATDIKDNVVNKVTTATEKLKVSSTAQQAFGIFDKVQEFAEANSAISKFVAVILSILVFYILFNLSIYVMVKFLMPTTHAKVMNGLVPSNVSTIVSANPNNKGSVPILRSVNQNEGLEYTWDFWFFINDVATLDGCGLIFSKGLTQNMPTNNVMDNSFLGVCPGAYIKQTNSHVDLIIAIGTNIDPQINNTGVETITINDIPLNKWIHSAIRVQNLSMDVYMNGVLTQRKNLVTLPNQNYGDTYIGDTHSFKGYVSSLNYYAYGLNYDQIQRNFIKGPNMKLQGQENKINYKDYLAMNWYYNTKS
jgi:hypothetical protein